MKVSILSGFLLARLFASRRGEDILAPPSDGRPDPARTPLLAKAARALRNRPRASVPGSVRRAAQRAA